MNEDTTIDPNVLSDLNSENQEIDPEVLADLNTSETDPEVLKELGFNQADNAQDTSQSQVRSVMGGYNKNQANSNTIRDISTSSNGALETNDVERYLETVDPKSLRVETDLPNLVRRDKAVTDFAGQSKENLEILKNNYSGIQQASTQAKGIANGSAISNWEKVLNQNVNTITDAYNALTFFYGNRSLEEFVGTANVLNAKKRQNQLTGPAAKKYEAYWKDESTGFTDFVKMVWDDPKTAEVAFQEALGASASVGASIAGSTAGSIAGIPAGPAGIAVGATVGAGTLNAIAEFGGYVSKELENYVDDTGNIDINKIRNDKNFTNRLRLEASAKGIATGVTEAFIGKIAKAGTSKIVNFVKPTALKDISKIRKAAVAGASIGAKAATEFSEEAGGSIITDSGMDAYKGRLTAKKFRENVSAGVREGVSGAVLGGASSAVSTAYTRGKSAVSGMMSDKAKAEEAFTESTKADKAKSFTQQVYELQNKLEGMTLNPDKVEELLAHSMRKEQVEGVESETTESQTTADGQVQIQLDMLEVEAALGERVNEFIESLPYEIQDAARKNLNEGGITEIPANIFVARTMSYPEVVALGIHPETDIHAHQAEEIHQRLEKEIESVMAPKLEAARKKLESGETVPEIVLSPMEGVSVEIKDSNTIQINHSGESTILNLSQEESAEEYAEVADSLVRNVVEKIPDILSKNPQFISNLTGVATRTIIKRARTLGVPAAELAKSLAITLSGYGAYVAYTQNSIPSLPSHIKGQRYNIGRGGSSFTIFHEIAHYILNGMAEDKTYLLAQSGLTEDQSDYLEVIKAAESFLGVPDIVKAVEFPSQSMPQKHPNPNYIDKARANSKGEMTKNQSGDTLNLRTITHEKFATTMERFILTGELPKEATEEFAKIFLYTKNTIDKDTEHLVSPETSHVSVEYTNAISPNDDISKVFANVYGVAEDFLTRVTPLFNFPELPVELLGAKGKEIVQKLSSVKYKLISQEFVKFYNNQTELRKKIEENITDNLTEENIKEAIVRADAPILNRLLDLVELGIVGKVRLSDLGRTAGTDIYSRVFGSVSEMRAATRLDDLAPMLSMTPEQLLVQLTREASEVSVNILKEARDQVLAKNPQLKTNKQIQEEFEKGIARALPTLLKKQMQDIAKIYPVQVRQFLSVMNRQSPQLRGSYGKMLQAKALNKVLAMPARNVTFTRLMGSVKRANNNVINAFSSGRLEASLQAKEEEVVASYILSQGIKLKPKIERAIKNVRDFARARNASLESGVAPEVINFVKLAIFNMAQGIPVSEFVPMTEAKVQETIAEAQDAFPELDLEELYKTIRDRVVIVSDETFSVMNKGDITDFNTRIKNLGENITRSGIDSVSSVLLLDDLIKKGTFFAERVRQAELEVREGERAEVAKSLVAKMEKVSRTLDLRNKLPFKFNDIHSVFRTMYKTDQEYLDSPIYKTIESVINGEANLTSKKSEVNDQLYDAFKIPFKSNEAFIKTLLGKYFSGEPTSEYLRPIVTDKLNFTFKNKGELLTAILLTGSDSGREKFLLSNGLVDVSDPSNIRGDEAGLFDDLDTLYRSGVITDADLQAVNKIWEVMAGLHPMISEVYRRQRGIFVGKIQASPFKVGGVPMTGGYYPIGYQKSAKLETSQDAATFNNTFSDLYNMMPSWMTKTRSDQVGAAPIDLSLNRISGYIDVALRTYYLEEALDTFASIINQPAVTDLLNDKRIGALADPRRTRDGRTLRPGVINGWVNRVRTQTVIDTSEASSIQRFISGNLPAVQYATGVVSAVVNLTSGLVPLFTEINPVVLALESLRTTATLGMQGVDPSAKSDYMRSREAQFVKFFIDTNNSVEQVYTSYEQFQKEYVRPFSFALMKKTQSMLEIIAWRASHTEALSKGKTETEAVREADFKVRTLVSGFEASAASEGQAGNYYTKLVNMASLHLYAGRRQLFVAFNREGSRVSRHIGAYATAITIAGVAGLVDQISRKTLTASKKLFVPPGEEEEENELAVLSSMFNYAFGPYGRVMDLFSKSPTPSANPLVSALNSSRDGLKAVYSGALTAPYPMTTKEKKGVIIGISLLTGIPFTSGTKLSELYDLLKSNGELYSEDKVNQAIRAPYKAMEKWEGSNSFID